MTPTEIINALRNIADVYEEMGVDHLQRAVMREAADTIRHLMVLINSWDSPRYSRGFTKRGLNIQRMLWRGMQLEKIRAKNIKENKNV